MVFIKTWNENKPAGADAASKGDDEIRDFKQAIRERLALDLNFFADESGQSNVGLHKKTSLINQGSDPATLADALILFAKDAGAKSELHSIHEDAITSQLTYLGKLWIESLSIASAARGDIIVRDATKFTRIALGASGTVLKSDGTDAAWGAPTAVQGTWRNLKCVRASASTVTLTADELAIEGYIESSVSLTADITASGANGLDGGAEAGNTWYYVWAIRKSSDGTKAALLSTSSTAPTMPSGYDQKVLASAVFNDGSSNFIDFTQQGIFYEYSVWRTLASGNVGLGSWTSIDTSNFCPSGLSTRPRGTVFAGTAAAQLYLTNDSTNGDRDVTSGDNTFNISNSNPQRFWEFYLKTADTIYWASETALSKVMCSGFVLDKLS